MSRKEANLAAYVEDVVEDHCLDIDPDELAYPDPASMVLLRADLTVVIEGAVADWIIEQKEKK